MTLPVLLSIPHGGTLVPPEVKDSLLVSGQDILDDGDAHTLDIYDIGAAAVVRADVARAVVDMNRSLQDMPPSHPDGLIKSVTCRGAPVYAKPPDGALRRKLIRDYYMPYHRAIQIAMRGDLQLCLDCHSMAETPPPVTPARSGGPRPPFCLSNRNGRTCSDEAMRLLADCIADAFGIQRQSVRLNDPFLGGHIVSTYGNNPLPWIQVEMNRSLYLSERWPPGPPLESRLRDLRRAFGSALEAYFSRIR